MGWKRYDEIYDSTVLTALVRVLTTAQDHHNIGAARKSKGTYLNSGHEDVNAKRVYSHIFQTHIEVFVDIVNVSAIELETKDGINRFVPISKNKNPEEESEATDVDLNVLALKSPPDGFMSLSDGPDALLDLGNESMTNVSLLESRDRSARSMEIQYSDALSSVSREPKASFLVSD
uniref:Uncharacterized protein n=1 Tax=Tanacetum cinerariifolium TaxID=118510 RepID=A0A6L2LHL8_TANCI|nr:hypothetical protein [Tanacetum cinerariifolium]